MKGVLLWGSRRRCCGLYVPLIEKLIGVPSADFYIHLPPLPQPPAPLPTSSQRRASNMVMGAPRGSIGLLTVHVATACCRACC